MARCSGVLAAVAAVAAVARVARGDAPASLTLDRAIQLALSNNERAAVAELNVTVADAGVDKARVAFLPALAATGSNALRPIDTPLDVAQGQLTVTQPLLVWSAFPLLDQAKHLLSAQRAQSADDKRQLAFDTARAYFGVLLEDEIVQAAQRKLDTANADLADTDAQVKAQLVSANDVTRAQIGLAGSVRELAADQGNLEAAYVQLELLVDARVARGLAPPAGLVAASEQPQPPVETLVAASLAQRPDLAAGRDRALAAHDFAREPHRRFYPTVSLVGQMTGTSNAPANGHDVTGTVSLTASWSIYDGGSRDADERSRAATAAIADLGTQALVRAIDAQVRSAAAELAAAQQALGAAHDAMTASRKSADETAILYRQGLAKAIELVDANEQRFAAEVNYAEAEFSVATAYLALRQAMGLEPIGPEGP